MGQSSGLPETELKLGVFGSLAVSLDLDSADQVQERGIRIDQWTEWEGRGADADGLVARVLRVEGENETGLFVQCRQRGGGCRQVGLVDRLRLS